MEARVRSVAWSKVSIRCEGNLAPGMPTRDDADDADEEDDDDDGGCCPSRGFGGSRLPAT